MVLLRVDLPLCVRVFDPDKLLAHDKENFIHIELLVIIDNLLCNDNYTNAYCVSTSTTKTFLCVHNESMINFVKDKVEKLDLKRQSSSKHGKHSFIFQFHIIFFTLTKKATWFATVARALWFMGDFLVKTKGKIMKILCNKSFLWKFTWGLVRCHQMTRRQCGLDHIPAAKSA